MELKGVTLYSEGYALLEFEKVITTSLGENEEFVISEVPGSRYGDRLSISPYDDTIYGFTILDCGWKIRTVSKSSWYESGSEDVKLAYEETKLSLMELLRLEKQLEFSKTGQEALDGLIKNSVSPKVLANLKGEERSSEQLIEDLKILISKVDDMRLESSEKIIDLQLKLNYARERAEAAYKNLQRLTDDPNCPHLLSHTTRPNDILQITQWWRRERTVNFNDIHLTYASKTSGEKICLKIEYLVNQANFRAEYNFRCSGDRLEKCDVEYSVSISQKTGVDWKNIPIFLTYGDPTQRQEPPTEIQKMFVDLKEASSPPFAAPPAAAFHSARLQLCTAVSKDRDEVSAPTISIRESFGLLKIRLPPNTTLIPQGASDQKIVISRFRLDAKLFHHVMPDSAKKAYRALLLTNNSDWVINNGEALNVYVQGNLIGTTRIQKQVAKGNLFVLYAGDDDLIEVTDLGDTDFKSKAGNFLSGNTKKATTGFKFIFKNSHDEDINLVVSYKLPESKNQQVIVTLATDLVNKSAKSVAAEFDVAAISQNIGDVLNTKTGSYIQHRLLKKGESWQATFGYSITYPHDESIKTWSEKVN